MEPTLVKLEIIDQPEILVVGKLLRVNAHSARNFNNFY